MLGSHQQPLPCEGSVIGCWTSLERTKCLQMETFTQVAARLLYRGRIPLEHVIRSLHFTCKTEPFRSGPDETRTCGLRYARAPRRFAEAFRCVQNACKWQHSERG